MMASQIGRTHMRARTQRGGAGFSIRGQGDPVRLQVIFIEK